MYGGFRSARILTDLTRYPVESFPLNAEEPV
jgi:hypothetical protein